MAGKGRNGGGMSGGARAGCGRKRTKAGPSRKEQSDARKANAKLLASLKEYCDPVKAAAVRKEQNLALVEQLSEELQPLHRANVEMISKYEEAQAKVEYRKRQRTLPRYILNEWDTEDKEKAAKVAAAAAPPKAGTIQSFFLKRPA